MSILQSFALGITQGLTEFLPISSSGHLILISKLFHWPLQTLGFDAALHLGTLFATLFYFRSDLRRIFIAIFARKNPSYNEDRRLALAIILGTIPAGIVGAVANDIIETRFRALEIVGANLIIFGIMLIAADFFAKRNKQSNTNSCVGPMRALIIGCAQIFSLIPGASRSGVTITAGIFSRLSRENAARFSFLISIPLIAAAGAFKLRDLFASGDISVKILPLAIGFVSSALVGLIAIKILMKTLSRFGLAIYGIYRIIAGWLILLFL